MKIEINNKRYLKITIDKYLNRIQIYTFDSNDNCEQVRAIDELEFIDLYNILTYSQDNNIDISSLWEVK